MRISNLSTLTMLGAAALAMAPSISNAQIVYSQAPSYTGTGYSSNGPNAAYEQILANSFSISSAASVNQVEWWGGYYNPGPDSFQANIYTDNGGLPNSGSAISLNLGPVTTVDTGNMNTGGAYPDFEVYEYTANLATPVSLAAATPYYFSVDNNGSGVNWTWAPSGAGNQYTSANGVNWSNLAGFGDSAFQLNNVATSGTPEPGAFALLGSLGVGGVAFLRRRRSK